MSEQTRLERAITSLECDIRTAEVARRISAALPDDSVFWGSDADGERFIEWGGIKPGERNPRRYNVRLYRA